MNKINFLAAVVMLGLALPLYAQDEHDHDEEEIEFVEMTPDERTAAGISTDKVAFRTLSEQVRLPAASLAV